MNKLKVEYLMSSTEFNALKGDKEEVETQIKSALVQSLVRELINSTTLSEPELVNNEYRYKMVFNVIPDLEANLIQANAKELIAYKTLFGSNQVEVDAEIIRADNETL